MVRRLGCPSGSTSPGISGNCRPCTWVPETILLAHRPALWFVMEKRYLFIIYIFKSCNCWDQTPICVLLFWFLCSALYFILNCVRLRGVFGFHWILDLSPAEEPHMCLFIASMMVSAEFKGIHNSDHMYRYFNVKHKIFMQALALKRLLLNKLAILYLNILSFPIILS